MVLDTALKLAYMVNDPFYAGLRPEHHSMVVHLKDQENSTPLKGLFAECQE